jgi:lipoate---protein ligase
VGAVSGRSLLSSAPPPSLFDVEQFRSEPRRAAVARAVSRPTLVLGSTQPTELVGPSAMRERGVALARRRGGGGAVYLGPGEQLWLDAWIPRDDPLWMRDVSVAAEWVGAWWMDALALVGLQGFDVHTGRSAPGDLGDLVCFAGRGPGEVFHESAKVVGLSQWRAREGALFSSCAYLRWDPASLLALVHVDEDERDELARQLAPLAVGLAELDPPVADLERVRELLLGSFPGFGLRPGPDGGTPGSA